MVRHQLASDTESAARFRKLALEIRDFGAAFGVVIQPYREESLPLFSRLSEMAKEKALRVLANQRDFFAMAQSEGVRGDSIQLIWRAFSKLGMSPRPDIFDKITEEDVVEVYHWDFTTSFKNLKFFEYISLSLEEIYCLPWTEQARFSPRQVLFFLEMNTKLKMGRYRDTFRPRFGHYTFREKRGEKRLIEIRIRWISPVLCDGVKSAMVFVNRARLLTDPSLGGPDGIRILSG